MRCHTQHVRKYFLHNSVPSLLASVMAILALSVPIAALADDGKHYPGSNYQALWDSGSAQLSNLYGKKYNHSTTSNVHVICAIIKDNYHNTNGTKSVSVSGYLYNTPTNSTSDSSRH